MTRIETNSFHLLKLGESLLDFYGQHSAFLKEADYLTEVLIPYILQFSTPHEPAQINSTSQFHLGSYWLLDD